MAFKITIKPSNHQYSAEADETILEAGLKHGFTMPYSCRDGVCGACKGRILEGEVDYGKHQPFTLTEWEKAEGLALFCRARPKSDLVIESKEATSDADIPVKTLPCRVQKMEKMSDDIMVLQLKLPANEGLLFLAGQYVDILQKDDKPRSFSLANAPHNADHLELHVRNIPGGKFTQHVFGKMKEKDILRIKGPLGSFFLHEDSDKPILFIASGTGFAPIKAIIEHALQLGITRPMTFYWGVRKPTDLYMLDKVAAWQELGISFTPVVSDESWEGREGFVHEAVLEDFGDLSDYQVYACGSPLMVEAAHKKFTEERGLPGDEFFSDAFTFVPKDKVAVK